jgi:hypothetical protein
VVEVVALGEGGAECAFARARAPVWTLVYSELVGAGRLTEDEYEQWALCGCHLFLPYVCGDVDVYVWRVRWRGMENYKRYNAVRRWRVS